VERQPDSDTQRAALAETLTDTGLDHSPSV
jgi:hypothetical protein